MSFHFDAVFYYVSDLKRAINFYQNVLGFMLTSQDAVARFDVDGVLFEVVPSDDPAMLSGEGNARLCLRVHNLEEAIQQLQRKGVHVMEPQVKRGGRLSSFRDPDGNEICLWEYAKSKC